jgi:predicted transposase YdaD
LEHRHELLVRSAAVLLHPGANSPVLTGERRLEFPGEAAYDVFLYRVVRVWQVPPDVLLRGGPGTLALAPISAVTEPELPDIIKRMEARLQSRRGRRYADEVWSAAFILMGLRYSRELARQLLRGVRSMKESVTYQAILEEGEAKGRNEGAVAEAQKILLRQGQIRFGSPDVRARSALEGITDVEQLESLGDRLLAVASWEELLGPPPARRSPSRRRHRT